MSKLNFTDGLSFDTQGPLRLERRSDGWYVIGDGMLCPVDDRQDGEELIEQLQRNRGKKLS